MNQPELESKQICLLLIKRSIKKKKKRMARLRQWILVSATSSLMLSSIIAEFGVFALRRRQSSFMKPCGPSPVNLLVPDPCVDDLDAIVMVKFGIVYYFVWDRYWKTVHPSLARQDKGETGCIEEAFPNFPSTSVNITAAIAIDGSETVGTSSQFSVTPIDQGGFDLDRLLLVMVNILTLARPKEL